jgi:large subunit ribosomal protein L32
MSKKPVPKKKQAVSSTRSRHSKYVYTQRKKLSNGVSLVKCDNCGEMKRAHFVCETCGMYKGKQILNVNKSNSGNITEIQA